MSSEHREYFNQLASVWNEKMPAEASFSDYIQRFDIGPGEHVMDMGTGTGRMVPYIYEAVGDSGYILAQDIAECMLIEGKKLNKLKNVNFVCEDAHQMAVKSNCFDKVLCFSAFPHFKDKNRILEEIHRILKPEGRLLILHNRSSEKMNAFHASLSGPVKHDRLPDLTGIKEMLQTAGFAITNLEESEALYWAEAQKPNG